MTTRRRFGWIAPILVLLLGLLSCARREQPSEGEDILARVGERPITVEEFLARIRYAMADAGEKSFADASVRRQYLDALIDERLAAIAARDRGLDTVANLSPTLEEVRDQAMLRELYLTRVREQVVVPQEEIQQAVERAGTELEVGFFRAASQEEALWVKERLLEGKSFAEIARTRYNKKFSENQFRRTIRWGETEPALEEVAYSLKVGEVSEPVPVDGAYYVLQLLGRRRVQTRSTEELRSWIERQLRRRKEAQLAREFMRRVFQDHPVSLNAEALRHLNQTLTQALKDEVFPLELDPFRLDSLARSVDWADTLLFHVGQETWRVRGVLSRISRRARSLRFDSLGAVGPVLTNLILQVAQDEALLQEARRLGLENHPRVKRDVGVWEDYLLAQILQRRLGNRRKLRAVLDSLRQEVPVVVLETKLKSLELARPRRATPPEWTSGALAFPPWPAD